MRLFHAPASPFVRKVMIVAHELGIQDRLELQTSLPSPVAPDEKASALNPLGKIPILVLEDGSALYDSKVIAEYLCSLAGDSTIFPTGSDRWRALTLQSLGDGVMEAAQLVRFETVARPKDLLWPEWREGQGRKISSSLAVLDQKAGELGWNIGSISVAAALGYLDFRLPDLDWRANAPTLSQWFADISARPSILATKPT